MSATNASYSLLQRILNLWLSYDGIQVTSIVTHKPGQLIFEPLILVLPVTRHVLQVFCLLLQVACPLLGFLNLRLLFRELTSQIVDRMLEFPLLLSPKFSTSVLNRWKRMSKVLASCAAGWPGFSVLKDGNGVSECTSAFVECLRISESDFSSRNDECEKLAYLEQDDQENCLR